MKAFLIQGDVAYDRISISARQPTTDGPLHEEMDLARANAQQLGRFGLNSGGSEDSESETLEGQCKA